MAMTQAIYDALAIATKSTFNGPLWYDNQETNAAVQEAVKLGYARRHSVTQVEWTESGIEAAKAFSAKPVKSELEKAAEMEWSKVAKEVVIVKEVCGILYGFGSELACLRLYKAFQGKGHVAFSDNLCTWYFTKD